MARQLESVSGLIVEADEKLPGFWIGRLRSGDTSITFKAGGEPYVRIGYEVEMLGNWTEHERWGKQFNAKSIHYEKMDMSPAGLEIWLRRHGAAKGIGPVRAKILADKYGAEFGAVLIERPEEIAEVAGILEEYARELRQYWTEHRAEIVRYAGLLELGLDMRQAVAVFESMGADAIAKVKADPYTMTEVAGIGFLTADRVASGLGIAKDDPHRIRAGICYWFGEEVIGRGSTCTMLGDMVDRNAKMLGLGAHDDLVKKGVADLLAERLLVQHGKLYAEPFLFRCEREIGEYLRTLFEPNPFFKPEEIDAVAARHYVGPPPWDPDPDQLAAIKLGLRHRGCLITGGAGSGKTTILRCLLNAFRERKLNVRLAAPTGKAAKRMEQVTGIKAETIHRLLGYNPAKGWGHDKSNPLSADVVIVDEASMISAEIGWRLTQAMRPGACFILVGDHHQLPPVDAGALLRDCIVAKLLPTKVLGHCHRQAGVLKKNCAAILDGVFAPTCKPTWLVGDEYDDPLAAQLKIVELYTQFVPDRLGIDPQTDLQVIVPMNKDAQNKDKPSSTGNPLATGRLNLELQRAWQRKQGRTAPVWKSGRPGYMVGDRVIQTKNNYQIDIMNGHQGIVMAPPANGYSGAGMVIQWEGTDGPMTMKPEDIGTIELSYALTTHKFQGSECRAVIVAVHSTNWYMLTRQWLYCSATRAKEYLLIVGDKKGIREACRKVKETDRATMLGKLRE